MSTASPAAPGQRRDPWRPRCLALTVPVTAGERVAVIGGHPAVAGALLRLGASPLAVLAPGAPDRPVGWDVVVAEDLEALPVPDAGAQHAIAVGWPGAPRPLVTELARIVAPSGGIFIGTDRRRGPRSLRPAAAARMLAGAFEEVHAYGMPNLRRPRHLVPLDSPAALRWYAASAYPAITLRQAVRGAAVRAVPTPRAAALLLPALGVTARRRIVP